MSEKITVFDIEILNQDPASICSIGIVQLEDLKIVNTYYSLIKPHNLSIDPYRYRVHKIAVSSLKKEKTFQEVWQEIAPFFEDAIVVSHDIQNDMASLRAALKRDHIPYPHLYMSCTYVLAHMLLPGLEKYNIATLASHYQIQEGELHHALSDAKYSAEILVHILEDEGLESITELHQKYHLAFGEMRHNYYRNIISPDLANHLTNDIEKGHPLFSQSVCFTGKLYYPKEYLEEQTRSIHAFSANNVNTHTNYLVIGKLGYHRVRFGQKNKKVNKALELIRQGQDLKIIHEKEYIDLLKAKEKNHMK